MDIGNVRPVMTGITTPVPRAPAQSVQTVQTDLPARSAVTETGKSDSNNVGTSTSDESAQATISHQRHMKRARDSERTLDDRVEMDSQTNRLVFQKVDVQSGDVVRQVPEESALRMHAMIVAWEGGTAKGHTQAYDQSV
ncbi:flagellar protein FlaG [Oryzibacter oryziterrae]|uniref:flagellar protein FlaG n=1 Tax=Oryzibacter oryziterrae TaxID=2766474 RepID=UPI001F315942|nr:flagellar protein FlaG [Oryzibacter oryziterrae]